MTWMAITSRVAAPVRSGQLCSSRVSSTPTEGEIRSAASLAGHEQPYHGVRGVHARGDPLGDNGHGHRLVVVEEQRGRFGTGAELVAAAGAGAGVDGVAEFAEPVHVPADRARADPEAVGQIGPGPFAVGLRQREQPQQPCRCLQHGSASASG